ncbi:MAG: hypothetical protein K9W43_09345 [Candidatus Thorarchaeota archaeon]|nr:hypothetical protein [Candidatus Thorarchaeota archaeon]
MSHEGRYILIVQTEITPEKHTLLMMRAKQENKSLKELLRQIIHAYLMEQEVDSGDSFVKSGLEGRKARTDP